MSPCSQKKPVATSMKSKRQGHQRIVVVNPISPKNSATVFPMSMQSIAGQTEPGVQKPGNDSKEKRRDTTKSLAQVVQHDIGLDSMEETEKIWKFVAVFLDRVLFLVNVLVNIVILTTFDR